MSRSTVALMALCTVLAACASIQRPPSSEDAAAKRFDTVPGQAVVYLFRSQPDFVRDGATVVLGDRMLGTTYPGTYFRLELAPGRYRLAGFAGDSGALEFAVQAGRLYFIEQSVVRLMRSDRSNFWLVAEDYGRRSVTRAELIGSR